MCGKCFNLTKTLRMHEKLHNPCDQKYQCKFCERKFTTMSHFKYHLATHQRKTMRDLMLQDEELKPIFCGGFDTDNLATRINMIRPRPFQCHFCNKSYRLKKYLQDHLKEHVSTKPRDCTICQKTFLTVRSLHQHMRVQHSSRDKFSCSNCGAQFLTKSSLTRHGLVHIHTRPYMCPVCNRRFKAKLYCERHIKKARCSQNDNSSTTSRQKQDITMPTQAACNVPAQSFNFQLDDDMEQATSSQQSNILVTNYVDNYTHFSEPDKYMVLSLDQNKATLAATPPTTSSGYFAPGYMLNQADIVMDEMPRDTGDTAETLLGLLENNGAGDGSSMMLDSGAASMMLPPAKKPEVRATGRSSLADKFPILKASLFSEDESLSQTTTVVASTGVSTSISVTKPAFVSTCDNNPDFYVNTTVPIKDTDEKLYRGCANCDQLFITSQELAIHVKDDHKLAKNFVCSVCYKAFSAKLSLWAHSKTHESAQLDKLLTCIACNQQFLSVSSLSRHVRMQHNDFLNFYRCSHCSNTYKTLRELDSHIKQILSEFDALIINSNYEGGGVGGSGSNGSGKATGNSIVIRQKKIVNDFEGNDMMLELDSAKIEQLASMDESSVCKASVKELIKAAKERMGRTASGRRKRQTMSGLENEMDTRLAYPYVCNVCHKGFNRTSNLQQHLRIHTKSKPYQCSKCDSSFRHRCSLKAHVAAKHSVVTKLLRCHMCDKFLRSNIALRNHMKIHLHQLEEDDTFRSHEDEQEHRERGDVEQRPQNVLHSVDLDECDLPANKFQCGSCCATFDDMDDFRAHTCMRASSSSTSIDGGVNCGYCKESFPTNNDFLMHYQKKHQATNTYRCSECNIDFAESSLYLNHVQNVHKF